jgi:hypothetical protein
MSSLAGLCQQPISQLAASKMTQKHLFKMRGWYEGENKSPLTRKQLFHQL